MSNMYSRGSGAYGQSYAGQSAYGQNVSFFFCCLDGIEISHLSMFAFVFVRFTNKFCVFLSMEFRSLVDCGADLVYVCCS